MTFWNLGLSTRTEQEQAYLNIIHDVKTTDKVLMLTSELMRTWMEIHMHAERRGSKFNTRKLLSYAPSRIQMDNSR